MPDSYEQQRQSVLNRNLQYSDPSWKITTFSNDKQEEEFQNWVQTHNIPFDPADPFPDYDMRAYYQDLKSGDTNATPVIDPHDNQIHYPDTHKTPYHETFSNESKYAKPGAPSWNEQDQLVLPNGLIIFSPEGGMGG